MARRRDMFIFAGECSRGIEDGRGVSYDLFIPIYRDAKNMATDVRNILLNVIKTKGGLTENDAQLYLKKMEAQKRYSADVWS